MKRTRRCRLVTDKAAIIVAALRAQQLSQPGELTQVTGNRARVAHDK